LSAAPRQLDRRATVPRLDHHLLVGAQFHRLAGRQHMVVEVATAGDPGAPRLDRQPPRAACAQKAHAAGAKRAIAVQWVEDRVLQNRHGSLLSALPGPEPETAAAH
jgi:hypothetical protein